MSSDLFGNVFDLFAVWEKFNADTFTNASKALAALFNTFLEFTGQQAVPNVLGGK